MPRGRRVTEPDNYQMEPRRKWPFFEIFLFSMIDLGPEIRLAFLEMAMRRDHEHTDDRWKYDGVRVIKGDQLDPNTPQTPGMFRQAAINHARVGAQKVWAGTVSIAPDAKTGVHHHGGLESVIYTCADGAYGLGERLQFVAEAGPGDFVFVPPCAAPRTQCRPEPGAISLG